MWIPPPLFRKQERIFDYETTWAFICAAEGTSSAHLRRYCRTVFECGYVPVCPRLQDGQFVALDDPDERHIYNDIVRDKLLRCPVLVLCGRDSDAAVNAQLGLAKRYSRVCTTLDGLVKAAARGESLVS